MVGHRLGGGCPVGADGCEGCGHFAQYLFVPLRIGHGAGHDGGVLVFRGMGDDEGAQVGQCRVDGFHGGFGFRACRDFVRAGGVVGGGWLGERRVRDGGVIDVAVACGVSLAITSPCSTCGAKALVM